MSINRIELENLLVFEGNFSADFCDGVNIVIGGNGTGKTTLLKIMYWACEYTRMLEIDERGETHIRRTLIHHLDFWLPIHYFDGIKLKYPYDYLNLPPYSEWLTKIKLFSNRISPHTPFMNKRLLKDLYAAEDFYDGVEEDDANLTAEHQWSKMNVKSVFIPTTEMLSHSRGLLALYRERSLPFDLTEIDIISKAELEPTREITSNAEKVIDKISSIIGGHVSFDGKDFFIEDEQGSKTHFSFEASGYRRLGLLWRLLRNGLLERNTILFWDEPENSLNPEHMPALVDVLLDLSRNGVQIFIATHSEMLASFFATNRQKGDSVLFHALYKEEGQIKVNSNDRFDFLEPNNLTDMSVNLYEKELEKGLAIG